MVFNIIVPDSAVKVAKGTMGNGDTAIVFKSHEDRLKYGYGVSQEELNRLSKLKQPELSETKEALESLF